MAEPFTNDPQSSEMDKFFDELSTAPIPAGSGNTRKRVTADMISFRYRWKQFTKDAGIEALIALVFAVTVFFHFRPLPESSGNHRLLSAATLLASGRAAPTDSAPRKRVAAASSVLLPAAGLQLATGGGPAAATALSLTLWLAALMSVYLAVRRLHSRLSGVTAVLLLSIFPAAAGGAVSSLLYTWLLFYSGIMFSLFIRSRQNKTVLFPLLAGAAAAGTVYCHPAAAVFILLLPLLPGSPLRTRLLFPAGAVAGALLFSGTAALLQGAPLFSDLQVLMKLAGSSAGNSVPLGGLFYRLATAPELLPYALLSLFAVGYTFRTPQSSYPHLPFHLLLGSYFLLEFFPVAIDPYRTAAGTAGIPVLLAIPFVLLLAPFLTGISNRYTVRWISTAALTGSIPLLFF